MEIKRGKRLRIHGECTLERFKEATAVLWPADAAPQKDYMVYEILRKWKESGRIRWRSETEEKNGVNVTKFYIYFSENSPQRAAN